MRDVTLEGYIKAEDCAKKANITSVTYLTTKNSNFNKEDFQYINRTSRIAFFLVFSILRDNSIDYALIKKIHPTYTPKDIFSP